MHEGENKEGGKEANDEKEKRRGKKGRWKKKTS